MTLASKDEKVGEGDPAANGDVVTVAFVGTLYPSGKQFAENKGFVFELGEGKSMPGFDKGLVGVRAGGKRILRVPPGLAFGNRGSSEGRIPPNADLQYDCEVKSIARGDVEKTIAKIGLDRIAILAGCVALLAISPMLG